MRARRRKCAFCGEYFFPDPRVGRRQKACFREECKRKRKARAQKKWLEKNPDYFRGRYGYVEEWLNRRPGYLQQYRETHPGYVEKNRKGARERKREARRARFDIQDEMKSQLVDIAEVKPQKDGFDIQDEIFAKLTGMAQVMLNWLPLIYKTR